MQLTLSCTFWGILEQLHPKNTQTLVLRYLKVIFVNLIVNQIQKVFPIFFVQTLKSTKKPTSFDFSNYPNFHETCKMTPLRCVQLKEIEAQQQWQNLDQPNENSQNLGRHQMFTFFRQTNFTKNFVKMI